MSGRENTFFPDIWAEGFLAQGVDVSPLLAMWKSTARRGHYVRAPRWVRRFLPRRGWVWDESVAEHRARLAAMPPVKIRVVRRES